MDPLTSFPVLSTTGNLRYLVSSSNLVAASRLVFSRTAIGEEVITSPMTLPLVLLSSLCISRNVCRTVIMSLKKVYGEEMTTNSFIKVVKTNETNNLVVQTVEHVILILTATEIYCLSWTD